MPAAPPAPPPLVRVGDQTDILGESPVWDERTQSLLWVDIRRPAIRRLHAASGRVDTWPLPELVGSIALTEDDGCWLIAMGDAVSRFDSTSGRIEPVAVLPRRADGHRFNDGRCDRQGRLFVSTMHNLTRAPEGTLYRLDRGRLLPVLDGLCIPNSLAWSPDGATMYFADSLRHRIDAHGFDIAGGHPGAARPFAAVQPPGFPDGAAVDAEGFVWSAQFKASQVVRYAPDGRVDRVIAMPVDKPTCVAFGGADLDVLYITTASQAMTAAELAAQPLAGALLAMKPGVRGLPEPRVAL
jgi:sugar lactone lactonase YvrE